MMKTELHCPNPELGLTVDSCEGCPDKETCEPVEMTPINQSSEGEG